MSDEAVDRCECINRSFVQLKEFGSLEVAQAETGCGLECEGCVSYMKLMFACGETSFAIDDPRLEAYE